MEMCAFDFPVIVLIFEVEHLRLGGAMKRKKYSSGATRDVLRSFAVSRSVPLEPTSNCRTILSIEQKRVAVGLSGTPLWRRSTGTSSWQ